MARRTINRRPVSINTPNSKDVEKHYFNHFNWKGINQNKNFLAVDQETFSDSKNVYVDDEGLLKSRLPLKFKHRFNNKILKDVRVFGEILLCFYENNLGEFCIGIIENEVWITDVSVIAYYPLKAFRNGNYIYIFVNNGILSYDIVNKRIDNALMYESITRVYTGGNYEEYEDENLFADYEKYQYLLYPSISGEYISNTISTNAYGKIGTYTHYIDNERTTHEIEIDERGDFLNIVHDQLDFSTSGYTVENCYGVKVPTAVIIGDFIYKYDDSKLYKASTSDLLFEEIYSFLGVENFVKLKVFDYDLYIIDRDMVIHRYNILDNTYERIFTGCINIDCVKYENDVITLGIHDIVYSDDDIFTMLAIKLPTDDDSNRPKYYKFLDFDEPSFSISDIFACTEMVIDYNESTNIENRIAAIIHFNCFQNGYSFSINTAFYRTNTYRGKIELTDVRQYLYDIPMYVYSEEVTIRYPSYIYYQPNIYFKNNGYYTDIECWILFGQGFTDYDTGNPSFDRIVFGNILEDSENFYYETFQNYHEIYMYNKYLYNNSSDGLKIGYMGSNKKLITTVAGTFVKHNNSPYWFYLLSDKNVVLSNYRVNVKPINVKFEKNNYYQYPDVLLKDDKIFVSKNNDLFIGDIINDLDDNLNKLYFKKVYKNTFDSKINGLHKISKDETAIFTDDNVWYNTLSDGSYYYHVSKITPILKNKSELITLPDSTTTFMPSENGIIALSYQNFINTTEQSTVNLTQDLSEIYSHLKNNIRSINWKQYILFYENENDEIIIYDSKINSWWIWNVPVLISSLFIYDNTLYCIAEGSIYVFANVYDRYIDELSGENKDIDWFIESQKLHFNANNYYKHIINITLGSVEDGDYPISVNLNVKNYRKYVDNGKAENFDYDIDVIRTFVKRLNYAKVCEFQYRISSDTGEDGNVMNVPLSLSNITITYKIGGQIR